MVQTLEKQDVELSPDPIYQIALGFAATKALLVAQRVGLFEVLGNSQKTAEDIATSKQLPVRTTELLLDTCVALRLCQKTGSLYSNAPISQRYLIPGKRGYLGRFMDHFNDLMYPVWTHLETAVRTTHAQIQQVTGQNDDNFFQAIDRQMEHLKTFMATMEEHSLLEGGYLANVYDFSKHQRMLDVAGGTGAMSVAIVERHPHLESIVFDRPPVCEIAQTSLVRHGLSAKIRTQPGDFFTDPLPLGADLVLLSAILHNWSPEKALHILNQIHAALPQGGTLLISEQVLSDDKTGPLWGLLCSLNMLIMMEGAREYSRPEFESMLSAAGFDLQEVRQTGGARQLLIAKKR